MLPDLQSFGENLPVRNSGNAGKQSSLSRKLHQFRQERPVQLELFELREKEVRFYSNTIELYDFIPKYYWGKIQRTCGKYLPLLEREFECRGKAYRVTIQPAALKDKHGIERSYYPSKREELVEDALRKMAVDGHGLFLDDAAGVVFSLHSLQQELKRNGHSYNKDQIKDALLICARTNLSVTTGDGQSVLVSNIFATLGLQSRDEWMRGGKAARAFVRFNPLVTEGIKAKKYRQFNYEKSMSYRHVIARQLHKRMSHHFTQASITQPYRINLSTVIRDFGLTRYEKPAHNLRDVEIALCEMAAKNVVLNYRTEKNRDVNSRPGLHDAGIIITPHPRFVSEIIQANKYQSKIVN